ncbi:hypothetical protein [Clostridium estertheticum]|uniref:hypothetical protein n=1 Tax=Clostridium estertheticum TaxID=238834 RepID=UPI001CF451E5|nr:hypothetical protein [Clostridium estertheticum]MCB2357675.1 hypothetical protein [Clostridium estertheticum]
MNSIVMNKLRSNFDIYLEHEIPKDITITDLLNEEKCLSFLQKYMTVDGISYCGNCPIKNRQTKARNECNERDKNKC